MKNSLLVLDSEWVRDRQPCFKAQEWLNRRRSNRIDLVMKALIKEERYEWAEWLLPRELGQKDRILWAASIAREVLPLYENKYPGDLRPRRAIEAAEDYANEPSEENWRRLKEAEGEAWAARAAAEVAARVVAAEAWAAVWAVAWAGAAAEAEAAAGAALWAVDALRYSGMPEEQIKAARKKWIEKGFKMLMAGYEKPEAMEVNEL